MNQRAFLWRRANPELLRVPYKDARPFFIHSGDYAFSYMRIADWLESANQFVASSTYTCHTLSRLIEL